MTTQTITLRVDAAEYRELAGRAERDKVTLSDYIRVRLGLRGQGSVGDAEIQTDSQLGLSDQAQLADHERRLRALEAYRS